MTLKDKRKKTYSSPTPGVLIEVEELDSTFVLKIGDLIWRLLNSLFQLVWRLYQRCLNLFSFIAKYKTMYFCIGHSDQDQKAMNLLLIEIDCSSTSSFSVPFIERRATALIVKSESVSFDAISTSKHVFLAKIN